MYEMRLLKSYTLKLAGGLQAETWVIYHAGDPGNSVLQVDLFVANDGIWHAWDGCFIRETAKAIARGAAETRNALQFG